MCPLDIVPVTQVLTIQHGIHQRGSVVTSPPADKRDIVDLLRWAVSLSKTNADNADYMAPVYIHVAEAAANEIRALRSQVEALEKDAQRYRWLRAENARQGEAYGTGKACVDLYTNEEGDVVSAEEADHANFEVYGMEPDKLDATIDAAITTSREG